MLPLFPFLFSPPSCDDGDGGENKKNFLSFYLADDERFFSKKIQVIPDGPAPIKAGGAVDPNLLALS